MGFNRSTDNGGILNIIGIDNKRQVFFSEKVKIPIFLPNILTDFCYQLDGNQYKLISILSRYIDRQGQVFLNKYIRKEILAYLKLTKRPYQYLLAKLVSDKIIHKENDTITVSPLYVFHRTIINHGEFAELCDNWDKLHKHCPVSYKSLCNKNDMKLLFKGKNKSKYFEKIV
jgi:hypothetical protein